jgi:hypothetical protein
MDVGPDEPEGPATSVSACQSHGCTSLRVSQSNHDYHFDKFLEGAADFMHDPYAQYIYLDPPSDLEMPRDVWHGLTVDLPSLRPCSPTRISSNTTWTGTTVHDIHSPPQIDEDEGLDEDSQHSHHVNRPARFKGHSAKPPERKSFACPYSKYDVNRYSVLNPTEYTYQKCNSVRASDISELTDHLDQVHRRPNLYCMRCYMDFDSAWSNQMHRKSQPPCQTTACPFPEKFRGSQIQAIRSRREAGDGVQIWYWIFDTLFPEAPAPISPYPPEASLDLNDLLRYLSIKFPKQFISLLQETLKNLFDPDRAKLTEDIMNEAVSLAMSKLNQSWQYAAHTATQHREATESYGDSSDKNVVGATRLDKTLIDDKNNESKECNPADMPRDQTFARGLGASGSCFRLPNAMLATDYQQIDEDNLQRNAAYALLAMASVNDSVDGRTRESLG